jgi:hypothetical protein
MTVLLDTYTNAVYLMVRCIMIVIRLSDAAGENNGAAEEGWM